MTIEMIFRKRDYAIVNNIISKKIHKFVMIGDRAFIHRVRVDFEIDPPTCKSVIYVTSEHDTNRLQGLRKGAAIYYCYGFLSTSLHEFIKYADFEEIVDLRYAKNFLFLMEAVRSGLQATWIIE